MHLIFAGIEDNLGMPLRAFSTEGLSPMSSQVSSLTLSTGSLSCFSFNLTHSTLYVGNLRGKNSSSTY